MIRLDLAACRDADPEMFAGTSDDPEILDAARALCARCSIRLDCLALALANPDTPGIWGGLTREQRNAMVIGRREHSADDAPPDLGDAPDADKAHCGSTDRILNSLFAAGLSLAMLERDGNLDPLLSNRVRGARAELDAASKEIYRSEFARKICRAPSN